MDWFSLLLAFCAGLCAGVSFVAIFISREEDGFDDGNWPDGEFTEEKK